MFFLLFRSSPVELRVLFWVWYGVTESFNDILTQFIDFIKGKFVIVLYNQNILNPKLLFVT